MAKIIASLCAAGSLVACSDYSSIDNYGADSNSSYGGYGSDYSSGAGSFGSTGLGSSGLDMGSLGSSGMGDTTRTALLGALIGGAAGYVIDEPLIGAGIGAITGAGIAYFNP